MIDPLVDQARQAQIDRANASEAKAQYELSKQIETDRQRTAFYNGLNELETHLNNNGAPIGTRQHAEAFSAYAHEFPLARSSADVQNALKIHALVNDDQAALKQRMLQLSPPPEKIAQRYAKVQGDVSAFQAASKVEEAANIAAGKANVPFSKSSDLAGATREAELLERAYPQLVPPLTSDTVRSAVSGTAAALTPPTAAPATDVSAQIAPQTTPTLDTTVATPSATPAIPVQPSATPAPDPTPHPLEGQTVRNKQTRAMGVITNGQFVPNEQQ
jgi:hypothetical protein